MSHWLLESIGNKREEALKCADRILFYREFSGESSDGDIELIQRTADALELVVIDLILEKLDPDDDRVPTLKTCAGDAYRLLRVLPHRDNPVENTVTLLRQAALAVIGDMGADAARVLCEKPWPDLPLDSDNWQERTWSTILDIWLRLIRKQGWDDRDKVLEQVSALRSAQDTFEKDYLEGQPPINAKASALELISLYHLAKAAEVFALFITDGVVDGNYEIQHLLEAHFDRVFAVCENAQMMELEPLAVLLSACSTQMVENSIWTVTRAVNSRVTDFVRALVDRGRGNKAIFDVLPPQRRALAEKGLLGSSRRAVVVSLPTSSGKTLIAQFRILQALNQYERERGWVAYLVPTKVLVNQITRQLRRDFKALEITVEQVSPALEIDNIEAELLQVQAEDKEFRVLVTTPEKLDLMLRQNWEEKIARPLTLVVVDEAHNLQSYNRGLRLELLLSTINKECRRAQFLLMTPFINNAREVARWLGGQNSDDISMALDWQPNDRAISIVVAEKGESLRANSYDYSVSMETVHTTKKTIVVEDVLPIPKNTAIADTYSKASKQGPLAAITAQRLRERGPVILMHSRPDWVWSLAEKLKIDENRRDTVSDKVNLVSRFLELEFGADFPLIELLSYGIGVHHAGLSDDVRFLMEWLFEENELDFLAATTTIAQGVNFPITGMVMAAHQYPYGEDMPPEDFWNIAGRAGRVGQGNLGIIALAAENSKKADVLREFINKQAGDLNSALIQLTIDAGEMLNDLGSIVYTKPEWSAFLQYLAHTYRQMGEPQGYANQIEQVLRGTLGFEKLRTQNSRLANKLLGGILSYTEYLQRPGQPLKLVDSTGFSLQSINSALTEANREGLNRTSWDSNTLFNTNDNVLKGMMGVLLKVPELRENLKAAIGGTVPDGQKLSLIVKDWVNGIPLRDIATRHFMASGDSMTKAMTKCGQNLFGRLTQTASWGLGALLSITGSGLSEEELKQLSNLPSRVYYGVNNDSAIALRLLGISRMAATPLANNLGNVLDRPLAEVREQLKGMDENNWKRALGDDVGGVYMKVWKVLEGLE